MVLSFKFEGIILKITLGLGHILSLKFGMLVHFVVSFLKSLGLLGLDKSYICLVIIYVAKGLCYQICFGPTTSRFLPCATYGYSL
jgi:hypothetical protein